MSQAGPVIALHSSGDGALLGVDTWPWGREKHLAAELQGANIQRAGSHHACLGEKAAHGMRLNSKEQSPGTQRQTLGPLSGPLDPATPKV